MSSDLSSPSGAPTFTVRPSAHPRSLAEREQALTDLAFGTVFTDHMVRATWTAENGWHDERVVAYEPISLDPAAAVLHYAQEIFEGLKAYRHADGSVWAFRPDANASRFAASAHRLALPELPAEHFLGSIEALVSTDMEWVPDSSGSSLYLRPFMFASEPFLGVRPSKQVDYLLIASPSGPYFTSGFQPVSIWVAEDYHRAGPGGTGAAKCGGNYAASLLPQQQAAEHGCAQVCFLDAATNTYLEELGGMNVFLVTDDGAVHTPELSGTILEGVTRRSILQLLRDDGREVHERPITLAEIKEQVDSGRITEIFACGTAAVVTPVGHLKGTDFDLTVADGESGAITQWLYQHLTDLQYGRAPDPHGWMRRLA
ncbi:branched-chain amino acid aminotransferase [Ruania alba]|uniref:Branched-chain-amino-acid aminotransferase n=1 Tax=Ruania alba TaxID=648782 RepID=A0A1H5HYI3_9MICO|nr:branched-chain amino acid aminotransferase [Ruania alba]SEE32979.1 branched chain amino acid aminotransferase apoenzyme [Ruania alba]SEF01247.1 branched chain amino acid aminotransferase apoenzyme [Ruania alba]